MINLKNDYNGICLKEILDAYYKEMDNTYIGYGYDDKSNEAKSLLKDLLGNENAVIEFLTGGTSTNKIFIGHALRPYEAVIACDTGHINTHETGAIEETGHKVLTVQNVNGKITKDKIEEVLNNHSVPHMVSPKMVYISNTTENGSVYSKSELEELYKLCKENNLYFYIDGARLGSALTSKVCDYTLEEMAKLCDAFYIGGTKNGLMLGEALVVLNDELKPNLLSSVKHYGGLLAKGFINGIGFSTFFKNDLWLNVAKRENELAMILALELSKIGYKLASECVSNQVFIYTTHKQTEQIKKVIDFEVFESTKDADLIRFVTSFMTTKEMIDNAVNELAKIYK